jgi:UDP:flavonoid glycosyltransferase YjiC (YdhE family)
MRFLICPGGGYGNLHPLVPYAQAMAALGHDVAFATSPAHVQTVASLGFEGYAVGPADGIDEIITAELKPGLRELDQAGRAAIVIDAFATLAQATVTDLAAVVEHWNPDALLRDTTALAAWIAGEQAGVPVALFDFGGVPPAIAARVIGPRLNRLRDAFGLPADPALATVYRWLVLLGAPPGWSDPGDLPATAHLLQPPEFDRAPIQARPPWLDAFGRGRRVIYATLGTVFGDSPDAWDAIFAAAAEEPELTMVATTGALAAERLSALPPNVRVARYLPQSYVLDAAAAVISHAGYGTLMGALRRGLPMVCLPMPAADNLRNASRMSALGAGLVVPRAELSPATIRQALRRVLTEPRFRQAAGRIAAAITALPPPEHGALLLERLARSREPITRP